MTIYNPASMWCYKSILALCLQEIISESSMLRDLFRNPGANQRHLDL